MSRLKLGRANVKDRQKCHGFRRLCSREADGQGEGQTSVSCQRSAGVSGGPEIGRVSGGPEIGRVSGGPEIGRGVRRSRACQRSTGESEKFGRPCRIILALCKAAIVAPRRPIRSAVEIVYRARQIASTINVRNERVLSVVTYSGPQLKW